MKILVVYYSKTGNTKKVANDLAIKLKADIEEIIDLKNRSGIVGWIIGGKDALQEKFTEIKSIKNPKDYDLVIIGTPVWAGNSTPAVRTYINKFKNDFKKVVLFITSGSTNSDKSAESLGDILDKKIEIHQGWTTVEMSNKKIYEEKINEFVKKIIK